MFVYVLLLTLIITPVPGITTDAGSIVLKYAYTDRLIEVTGFQVNGTRVTNVGTGRFEKHSFSVTIVFNGSYEAVRYFFVNASAERYEVRNIGDDRDVVYDCGNLVLFIHARFELHANKSFVRFKAKDFVIDVGVYEKGSPSYLLLALTIVLVLLAIVHKLFPKASR